MIQKSNENRTVGTTIGVNGEETIRNPPHSEMKASRKSERENRDVRRRAFPKGGTKIGAKIEGRRGPGRLWRMRDSNSEGAAEGKRVY